MRTWILITTSLALLALSTKPSEAEQPPDLQDPEEDEFDDDDEDWSTPAPPSFSVGRHDSLLDPQAFRQQFDLPYSEFPFVEKVRSHFTSSSKLDQEQYKELLYSTLSEDRDEIGRFLEYEGKFFRPLIEWFVLAKIKEKGKEGLDEVSEGSEEPIVFGIEDFVQDVLERGFQNRVHSDVKGVADFISHREAKLRQEDEEQRGSENQRIIDL